MWTESQKKTMPSGHWRGGVLHNEEGATLCVFFKQVSAKDSNGVEVMKILEVLRIYSTSHQARLLTESDSFNAILWMSSNASRP